MIAWTAATAYAKGSRVLPVTCNGYHFRATAGGTTGSLEPVWVLPVGQTVADNGMIWQCVGFAPYFAQGDLEDRITAAVVKRLLDDNRDGFADGSAFQRLQLDACAFVNGYLRPQYARTMPFLEPYPGEIARIALDVAEAMGAKRHPRLIPRDWEKLMAACRSELVDLSRGVTRLDVLGPPEPAANEGGMVGSGDPISRAPKPKFFTDNMGDF